jgi:predicted RNA-binding protein
LTDYLLPIADREPLRWIVAEQQTAVGAHRRRDAERLRPGDRLFLYTTRGCFRNPTRDRGRVIGIAAVISAPRETSQPIIFGGREFPLEIPLRIECITRFGEGVELVPLVQRLKTFPNKKAWSVYLRRALVPLAQEDVSVLEAALEHVCHSYRDAAPSYRDTSGRGTR